MIRRDDVRHIARLARLALSPEEEERASDELGRIVEWVDRLRDFASDPPEGDATSTARELADDVPGDCLDRDGVLANAPRSADGFVLVPSPSDPPLYKRGVRGDFGAVSPLRTEIPPSPPFIKGGAGARGDTEPLWRLTATTAAAAVRQGDVTAEALLDACLARLAEVEPRVHAFVAVEADAAREAAREVDRRRRRGGELGLLAGVPVAVKDNLARAGRELTCGSRILAGYVSPYTATAVAALEAAGAVVVGRTNLDEFAMGSSVETSAWGPTRNPWHLGRVPGGSSGGSAAAVAASAVPLALGSDTGGSIRQPAALSGVVGLKPTWGRVSRWGLVAFASSTDVVGPLTRSVADAALALAVLAGADDRDATASRRPVEEAVSGLDDGVRGFRVGTLREVDLARLPAAVAASFSRACDLLRDAGATVREVSVPNVACAVECYYLLANSEASANLARFDGVRYGRRVEPVEGGLETLHGRTRGEGFGDEVKRRILLGTFALSAGYHDAYYARAEAVRRALRRQLAAAFAEVDAVVTPTAPGGAFRLGEKTGDPIAMYLSDVFTTPASLAGNPAVSVPCGHDGDGLPLGLQVVTAPFADALALRVARTVESALALTLDPPFTAAA